MKKKRGRPPIDRAKIETSQRQALTFSLSEYGLAQRFHARHFDDVRLIPAPVRKDAQYMTWTGQVWTANFQLIEAMAVETIHALYDEILAAPFEDTDARNAALGFVDAHEVFDKRLSFLKDAMHFRDWNLEKDAFDRPELFSCQNCTVDPANGPLPFTREHYITRQMSCNYDPTAKAPKWRETIKLIANGDAAMERFFQCLGGMFLAGTNEDQLIIILIGQGGTGKSAYINPIAHVLGGYALPSEFQSFVASKGSAGGARGDLAEMEGYRLVYSPEADNREELAESILKVFSGGDKVSARGLYQSQARKFLPSCVIVITSNKRPLIVGQDSGIWRRIVPVPFEVVIEHATTRILKYNEKELYPEASGILNWMIEGYQMWRSDGRLILPHRVAEEQAMFKASSDILAPFFEDYLNVHVVKVAEMSTLSTLYKTYLLYCQRYNQGTRAMNRPNFASALVSRGWKQFPAKQGTCFRKTTEVNGRLVVEGLAVKSSYETASLTQEREAQVMGRVKHLHLAHNGSQA